ncbi:shikimate kinase [Naasia lichenicola]|uniref:Shikimate kinase n=1 Tax=Naasia lichenicola TaxID=2565933 RepID=A0A4S4FRP5_9MICO|nr:shikimate kinase [Naasia lichenicola]THG33044.1 AAA family ATPase [Naasia lichenicola]
MADGAAGEAADLGASEPPAAVADASGQPTEPVVVLIGPPGAGKTKVGKRVARALGTSFTDTDRVVVAEHGTIADIWASKGELHFRELEREAVRIALAGAGVVALGGGAVLDPRTQADLSGKRVALIMVDADAVADRIEGDKRPLLTGGGVAAWSALVDQRMPLYTALASRTFDTSRRKMDAVAEEVTAWLTDGDAETGSSKAPAESAPAEVEENEAEDD